MTLSDFVRGKPLILTQSDLNLHRQDLERISDKIAWMNFAGEDLSMLDLSGLVFKNVCLDKCQLTTANLSFTTFIECQAREVRLAGTSLQDVIFVRTDLYGSSFIEAQRLSSLDFPGSNLAQALFPDNFFAKAIALVNSLAKSLKSKGLFLITGSIIVALVTLRLSDLEIFTDAGAMTLPFTSIPVNFSIFALMAPFSLTWIYIYFHIMFNKFYTARLKLPNIFPDGLSIEQVCEPSIFFSLFSNKLSQPRFEEPNIARPIQVGYIYLQFFFLVPLSILTVIIKVLVAQMHGHALFIGFCFFLCIGFSLFMTCKARLSSVKIEPIGIKRSSSVFIVIAVIFLYTFTPTHLIVSKENITQKLKGYVDNESPTEQEQFLIGKNLSKRSFNDLEAKWAFLPYSDLSHASLKAANLQNASMEHTNFQLASLEEADLSNASLVMSDLNEANLHDAIIVHTNLSGVINLKTTKNFPKFVTNSQLDHIKVTGWRLTGPQAKGTLESLPGKVLFSGCTFRYSDFSKIETHIYADFIECDFSHSTLPSANLMGCKFTNVDFFDANCNGTSFCGSIIIKNNFELASLRNTDLSCSTLISQDFACVDLSHCSLAYAELLDVDLRWAILKPEQLETCVIDEYTQLPLRWHE